MADPAPDGRPLLTALLREVSRSFYLTLRVLPAPIRQPVGLAYLLARATDTIADTEVVPLHERLAALDQLRARIRGQSTAPLDFSPFTSGPGLPSSPRPAVPALPEGAGGRPVASATAAERVLLMRMEESLAMLAHCHPEDQQRIRNVLETITSGQELDLRRFAHASASNIVALPTAADLEDYTYRVAGCVGEFWTQMCRARLFPQAPLDEARLLALGVRFGQGLQLVNILRDLPADLRKGRCYLPADGLAGLDLGPKDLLNPAQEARLRPLYLAWLERAWAHLAAGWDYTNRLPRGCVRVRLACAWPILIGGKTLEMLASVPVLAVNSPVKVDRATVRRLIISSIVCYPWPKAWERLFAPPGCR